MEYETLCDCGLTAIKDKQEEVPKTNKATVAIIRNAIMFQVCHTGFFRTGDKIAEEYNELVLPQLQS